MQAFFILTSAIPKKGIHMPCKKSLSFGRAKFANGLSYPIVAAIFVISTVGIPTFSIPTMAAIAGLESSDGVNFLECCVDKILALKMMKQRTKILTKSFNWHTRTINVKKIRELRKHIASNKAYVSNCTRVTFKGERREKYHVLNQVIELEGKQPDWWIGQYLGHDVYHAISIGEDIPVRGGASIPVTLFLTNERSKFRYCIHGAIVYWKYRVPWEKYVN